MAVYGGIADVLRQWIDVLASLLATGRKTRMAARPTLSITL